MLDHHGRLRPHRIEDDHVTETEIQALHLCLSALDDRLDTITATTTRIDQRFAALTTRMEDMEARYQQQQSDTIRRIIREELDALAQRRQQQHHDSRENR